MGACTNELSPCTIRARSAQQLVCTAWTSRDGDEHTLVIEAVEECSGVRSGLGSRVRQRCRRWITFEPTRSTKSLSSRGSDLRTLAASKYSCTSVE